MHTSDIHANAILEIFSIAVSDLVLIGMSEDEAINGLLGQASVRVDICDDKVQAAIDWLSQRESNKVDVLRDWFLVSSLQIGGDPWAEVLVSEDNELVSVEIAKAKGFKCERCWHYEIEMSNNLQHPNICKRCEKVVLAL